MKKKEHRRLKSQPKWTQGVRGNKKEGKQEIWDWPRDVSVPVEYHIKRHFETQGTKQPWLLLEMKRKRVMEQEPHTKEGRKAEENKEESARNLYNLFEIHERNSARN